MSIPLKDSLLAAYSANMNARLAASGTSVYLLSPGQIARYAIVHEAFATAYSAMVDARAAGVRSEAQTREKERTRLALVNAARQVYATVQADQRIDDADKVLLGVHVRAGRHTPSARPGAAPAVDVVSVVGRTVTIGVHDPARATRRGKAPGAVAAWVYSFVGPAYPADPAAWAFEGAATRGTFAVTFPAALAGGTSVWLRAAWINARQLPGPVSAPVTTTLQWGGTALAA